MSLKCKIHKLEMAKSIRNIEFLHHRTFLMIKINLCTDDDVKQQLILKLQACTIAQRKFNEKIDKKIHDSMYNFL